MPVTVTRRTAHPGNVFMTFAWYAPAQPRRDRRGGSRRWPAGASRCSVPAAGADQPTASAGHFSRSGNSRSSEEVITLVVFVPFAVLYTRVAEARLSLGGTLYAGRRWPGVYFRSPAGTGLMVGLTRRPAGAATVPSGRPPTWRRRRRPRSTGWSTPPRRRSGGDRAPALGLGDVRAPAVPARLCAAAAGSGGAAPERDAGRASRRLPRRHGATRRRAAGGHRRAADQLRDVRQPRAGAARAPGARYADEPAVLRHAHPWAYDWAAAPALDAAAMRPLAALVRGSSRCTAGVRALSGRATSGRAMKEDWAWTN